MEFDALLNAKLIFGWQSEAVEQLRALERAAYDGRISLTEWREQDAALRAGLPDVDLEGLVAARKVARATARDEGYENDATLDLFARLSIVERPAPTDGEIRERLARLSVESADVSDALARKRARLIEWLRQSEDRDPQTMLSLSFIAQFRIVEDPHLGAVPQNVNVARKKALEAAAEDLLEEARALGGGRFDRIASAVSEMTGTMLTFFPKLILNDESAPERADAVRELWNHEATQQALRRETAGGWPPEYS